MEYITLEHLVRAWKSLKRGYKSDPTSLERDGIIQRFEYTLDLSWKTAKKVLQNNGIEVDTPKNVVRELGSLGWLNNPADWIDYIEKRNQTSHMYNEPVAEEIFSVIQHFITDAEALLMILQEKNK